ncbi:DUF2850 domain-containing protein [Vibrio vulnificus]|uniref:DUF2850 domain-containing protein n=1 Tax=Vibrio vulnificus TaxID=672 RepID=UPI002AAF0831|nr:DUF2850 domain-containing protein [Vibrio vulnificus]EHI9239957.1 DUF2850 domain-containing protein [Vibrio vulnificus]EMA2412879.1 DUF2850 domain-containing protein [Vibrio vulnificus]
MNEKKMSSASKKSTAVNGQLLTEELRRKKRKLLERILMGLALVGTVIVLLMYGDLITRLINPPMPKSMIYGKWVEQDVAPYAREVLILNESGVTVNGSLVTTNFDFDGKYFEYRVGGETRRFRFIGQQYIEMKLDSDAHYLPTFQLEGKQNLSLR